MSNHNRQFKLLRLTDAELLEGMKKIQEDLQDTMSVEIAVHFLTTERPLADIGSDLHELLQLNSTFFNYVALRVNQGNFLKVTRDNGGVVDTAEIQITDSFPPGAEATRRLAVAKTISSARQHLRFVDVDCVPAQTTSADFQKSAEQMLQGLQVATADLLTKAAKQRVQLETELREKYSRMESELFAEIAKRKETNDAEFEARSTALATKEKAFETKHARYLSREVQKEQTAEIKGWIENWKLTDNTIKQRFFVKWGSLLGSLGFFALAWWSFEQSIAALSGLTDVPWWIWLHFTVRSAVPLAASISFLVFYIRWQSTFADRHASEEFLNRRRLLDVGRSYWLLEAVRDAQDNQTVLPQYLIHELSKNLFEPETKGGAGQVLKPNEVGSILLQNLKIKSPDGTELELASQDRPIENKPETK